LRVNVDVTISKSRSKEFTTTTGPGFSSGRDRTNHITGLRIHLDYDMLGSLVCNLENIEEIALSVLVDGTKINDYL
jgi:hypothetical protein